MLKIEVNVTTMSEITINIYGGNNLVMPNATHAEQHYHHNSEEPSENLALEPSPHEEGHQRLSIYINKEEDLNLSLHTLPSI